ncbi:uncharacterized protein P884DRAFT_303355 [Thermothelomyces heterothallicus CBS 202.75]|uniref:uncharacterized protein n=1 Tax=Thermothelomyces heterothallicus CBS 202.75 TaxID=1149848 RepID=UPI0037447605
MARRKGNGSRAPSGDASAAPRSRRQRASASQTQEPRREPKSRPKQNKKPADLDNIPTARTEQRPRAKPQTSGKPRCSRQPEPAAEKETTVKVESPANGSNRQSFMDGRRKDKNAAAPARNPQTAKPELPEGWTRPSHLQARKIYWPRHAQKTVTDGSESGDMAARAVLPWVVDPSYPKPLDRYCAFNYGRPVWHSLLGKNIAEQFRKEFARSRNLEFRRVMDQEELRNLHRKFWKAGEPATFKAKMAYPRVRGTPRLFIVSSASDDDAGTINPANDRSVVIRLLQVTELAQRVLNFISPSIGDITALAMTCKRAAALTRASYDLWDFNLGSFPTDDYVEKRDGRGRILQGGGVRSNTLIIAPASDEPKNQEKPYMADFKNLLRLCVAITEIPSTFSSIIIDRLQFFDLALFEMMVNTMPNLKVVTITRCPMLDVTKLRPLLELIKRHPLRSGTGKGSRDFPDDDSWTHKAAQSPPPLVPAAQDGAPQGWGESSEAKSASERGAKAYIRLDFFPFFFHGPPSGPRLGSYGVTHNEPTFNTPKAVFALILRCQDLAKEVGSDLLSDSSSFWSFIRQLPGPDVLWALKAREAVITRERELAEGKKPRGAIENDFADDLTAALTGDNQKHPKVPPAMMRYLPSSFETKGKYWRQQERCRMCQFTYPVSLFPLRRDTCWSCKMTLFVVNMEDSHLRLWQETALQHWRVGLNPASDKLDQLLANGPVALSKALYEVQYADWTWEYFLNFAPEPDLGPEGKANGNASVDDWATGTEQKVPYCPPTPRSLDTIRASLARWRWAHSPATKAFDYREGGPQRAHPCMFPLSPSSVQDCDFGAEEKEHFNRRWVWTRFSENVLTHVLIETRRETRARGGHLERPDVDESNPRHPFIQKQLDRARRDPAWRAVVRDRERRFQNKKDKTVYMAQLAHVEDCLHSMSTLARKPFNIDEPIPDPALDRAAYKKLLEEESRLPGYGFRRNGEWQ